ncbi:uncharacterized protein LOC108198228 [Daucus carota subsp. sativus]|uniref:uncharacterized protein LOC108198228 n=1 Tax=Daucus carota subsp. sativus TaxID=79200 RepID=UPI0030829EEB
MSDHTPEKYSNLSGGARKRISDSSDTTLEGECKRRGCRTTLDKYLLQRQNDIRNGETNPSHVESNSNRSPLSGIDNVQMAIAATATLEVQRKNNTRPPLSVIDNIQTPVTAAIRRRRGPNINSLFEAGSLRISDNVDKENRLRARSRTGRGPSLPDQFCISHKNKESPSNAMSTSLCELTNNASPDTLESCVSTGSAQSAVAPVKRKGSVRGLSIEKQLRNLEIGRPSHVNTPTLKNLLVKAEFVAAEDLASLRFWTAVNKMS